MILKKPVKNLKKEEFFSKLKNKCPDDDETERTREIINMFDFEKRGEITRLYCKRDVIILADVFEEFVKVSTEDYGSNPLDCVSLTGNTYQCAFKHTDIKLQTLHDKDLILLKEKNKRGGISFVMGDRYVESDENKKILYADATNLFDHSMSQMLPYDEFKFEKNICSEEILNTPGDNDIGYFSKVDLKYPDNMK